MIMQLCQRVVTFGGDVLRIGQMIRAPRIKWKLVEMVGVDVTIITNFDFLCEK